MKRGMPPGGVNPLPTKLSNQAFAVQMEEHGSQAEQMSFPTASSAMQGDGIIGIDCSLAAVVF